MDQFMPFRIKPALAKSLLNDGTVVAQALRDGVLPAEQISKPETFRIRPCAGLLVAHAARKDLEPYLARMLLTSDGAIVDDLVGAAESAYASIGLPGDILAENWTIDPFGLRKLFEFLVTKIGEGAVQELIPVPPADAPSGDYEKIFGRMVVTLHRPPANSKKKRPLAGRFFVCARHLARRGGRLRQHSC